VSPTEILAALARHGTRVMVDGERVRLIHDLGNAPPAELVNAAREAKAALRQLLDRPASSEEAPEQTARWTQLVLQWGASINEGVAVVQRVCAAAGPLGYWRRAHVGTLFAKMEDRHCWPGRRKIEQLKVVADKMKADQMYWPASRPDKTAAGRDNDEILLRALARGQRSVAQLVRMTGLSKNAVSSRLQILKKAGKVICVNPAVFALPESGAARHVPACEAIIATLSWAPGHQATANVLADETGLTRNAIDSSANRMIDTGTLVRPKRGVFALSPETLRKIQRREPIRIGHSVFILDLQSQRVALRIVRG
jgi:biotin operon repressor